MLHLGISEICFFGYLTIIMSWKNATKIKGNKKIGPAISVTAGVKRLQSNALQIMSTPFDLHIKEVE